MDLKAHAYRVGSHSLSKDDLPSAPGELSDFVAAARKRIEPWLAAVFQSEHLNLLIGSGFPIAVAAIAGASSTAMAAKGLGTKYDAQIDAHAAKTAKIMKRGKANMEDQLRSAIAVVEGLKVLDPTDAKTVSDAIDTYLKAFLASLLEMERGIAACHASPGSKPAETTLQSFLLSFASRAASRERLHVFTTNYDRLIEHGCDLTGLRTIDRFVGALNPVFRASRVEVDMHYNPPGIRGEPRFMEGVVRLTKLHGSLDWSFDGHRRTISRKGIPFGAPTDHTDVPKNPVDTMMIYPNPAKDVETTEYPYAELFRDFAAAVCRPNAVIVTYGYGFGDDHVNRVLHDMLTVPSTHLVVISRSMDDRLKEFLARTIDAQVSLLLGQHFSDLEILTENYLPKPSLDYITNRMAELIKNRPAPDPPISTTPSIPPAPPTPPPLPPAPTAPPTPPAPPTGSMLP